MIATKQQRLKSGTAMILNGKTVWVERHREDNNVVICDNQKREYFDNFEVVSHDDLVPVRKGVKPIVSKPKVLTAPQKEFKDDLSAFYDDMAKVMPFNCMECLKPLYAANKFARRCVTAHILPKGLFPSVATNVHNILFLGAGLVGICRCHDFYDASVENRVKMKVYKDAIESFVTYLRHELPETQLTAACEYLGLNWKDYV